jgi:hypothetical protein
MTSLNLNNVKTTSKLIKKAKSLKNNQEKSSEQNKDLARLVDYYRMRVENFDKERVENLEKLEQLKLTQEEQHKMEWENKRRKDEITELQEIVSRNNNMLNRERRQNLFLQFELENREMRNQEDRRRLIDIMKLAEPVEQTYKLYQDKRPDVKEKFAYYDGYVPENRSLVKPGLSTHTPLGETIDESSLRNRTKSPVSMFSRETNYSLNNKSNIKSKGVSGIGNKYSGGTSSLCNNSVNSNFKDSNSNVKNKYKINTNTAHTNSNTLTALTDDNSKSKGLCNNYTNNTNSINNINKPSSTKIYYSKNINKSKSKIPCEKDVKIVNKNDLEYRIYPSDEKQQIVRTIVLPKEEESLLIEEVNFLKKQVKQTREFYENQLNKMDESRKLKDEETKLQLLTASERIEELIKRNQKLENLNYEITKDYLHLKFDSSQVEKRLYEELELIKLQNESLSSCVKDLSSKRLEDKELCKNDFERKTKELSTVLRNQIRNYEEQNNLIKEQYKQVQKVFTNKLKDMEDKLTTMTSKYKLLESRRNNEHEGYLNEICLIRQRVKSYEDYIYKLKMYTHGKIDRTNLINNDLNHNEKDFVQGSNNLKKQLNSFEKMLLNNQNNVDSKIDKNDNLVDKENQNDYDDDAENFRNSNIEQNDNMDNIENENEDNQYDNDNYNNNENPNYASQFDQFADDNYSDNNQMNYNNNENDNENYRSSYNNINNARSDNEPESDYSHALKKNQTNNNNNLKNNRTTENTNINPSYSNFTSFNNNKNYQDGGRGYIKEEEEDY